jgi:hypothetical protein
MIAFMVEHSSAGRLADDSPAATSEDPPTVDTLRRDK